MLLVGKNAIVHGLASDQAEGMTATIANLTARRNPRLEPTAGQRAPGRGSPAP